MYSHVDTIFTPSLINIQSVAESPKSSSLNEIKVFTEPNSISVSNNGNSFTPIGSSGKISLSPNPGNFPSISSTPIESLLTPTESLTPKRFPSISEKEQTMKINRPNEALSATGPIPIRPIPAFAPPKNIDVAVLMNKSLKAQLESDVTIIRKRAMMKLEKKIVTMQGYCPDNIVNTLKVKSFQLDANLIEAYLKSEGRYDHNYQDGMGCLIDALVAEDDIIENARLNRWITNISKIGASTAEGMVFELQSGSHPLYVIKITNDPKDDTLPHEAIIGMGAINKLRDKIPNFMHTYGAFMCSPPVLDKEGKVIAWCPNKTDSVAYLVLENIQDSTGLDYLAWDLNEDEFLQIYLQVLNALNVAYKEFDFTHYDLHAGNVIIQRLSYDVLIPFYLPDGRTLYIKTRYLIRIIDYGMSHIYLQGQHFGRYGLEYAGINAEASFPMHDAYKLLFFTYYYSLNKLEENKIVEKRSLSSLSEIVNEIYEFFKEGKIAKQRIEEREKNKWEDYYQPNPNYKSIKFDDLILYILSKRAPDFMISEPSDDAILTICSDKCVDWNGFIQNVFNQDRLPTTLEDYCQAHTAIDKLAGMNHKNNLKKWLQQFDINMAYDSERDVILDKLNNCINDINHLNLVLIDDKDFNYAIYVDELKKLIKINSKLNEIKIWIAAATCAFNINQDLISISQDIKEFMKAINKINSIIIHLGEIIQYNISADTSGQLKAIPNIDILHNIILS